MGLVVHRKKQLGCLFLIATFGLFCQDSFFSAWQRRLDNIIQTVSFDPIEELSQFYTTVFDEQISDEMEEIQREVRLHRKCVAHPELDTAPEDFVGADHVDSHITTVACVPVHYRIPSQSVENINDPLVFGILSGDKNRRNVIRNTWADGRAHFFILAGDWENVEEEYNEFGDILWVDQPESYKINEFAPRKGALTSKSGVMLSAMYNQIVKQNHKVEHMFKVDDDCYVDVPFLIDKIEKKSKEVKVDYWGHCPEKTIPFRVERHQWYAAVHDYPFTHFPHYCLGGHGYVYSSKFLECTVGEGHLEDSVYSVNEDVFVGTLAEKCGFTPPSDHIHTELYLKKERDWRTAVQHEVKSADDMTFFHDQFLADAYGKIE